MNDDELDRMGRRAAASARRHAATHADPDGDLAAVFARADAEVTARRGPPWWFLAAAAAGIIAIAVGAIGFVNGRRDGDLVAGGPGSTPTTTTITTISPATNVSASLSRSTPGGATTVPTVAPPPTTASAPDTPPATTTTTVGTSATSSTQPSTPVTTAAPPTEPPTTTTLPYASSDEVLADPDVFGDDGRPRRLVDRSIVVGDDASTAIPIDVPESELRLIGVGPDDVAYVWAVDPGTAQTRIVAVPTSGPNVGVVTERAAFAEDGPWYPRMTETGVDTMALVGQEVVPYLDADGAPVARDDRYTWSVEHRFDDADTAAVITERATGATATVPETVPAIEGYFDGPIRPLPDGRVVVTVSRDGTTPVDWAYDPGTGTWTEHPR